MSDSPATPPADEPTTALAERRAANPLALVDEAYTKEEITAIASFVGVAEDSPAMRPFLGVAAHLGLSPILGEIWLIEGSKWNKETREYEKFYRPSVGRDGFLKHAEERPAFKGLRSRAVCANDTFEVEDDGWETKVLHRMASLQPGQDKGHESRWRGPVVGAWAKLYFSDGRPPLFYFAPAHEHVRTKVKDGKTELMGAWGYMSAMCEKAAQSYVLRLGFRITGVIPRDELREDDPGLGASAPPAGAEAPSLADDPMVEITEKVTALDDISDDLRSQLLEALRAINDLSPFSWPPSKVDLRLGARTEDDVRKLLGEVEDEFTVLRERQAETDARLADEAAAEEAIQVVRARDVKPPIEVLVQEEGEEEPRWALAEDVIFDDEAKMMVLKLAEGGERTFAPTEEIEVRTPVEPPPEEAGADPGDQ